MSYRSIIVHVARDARLGARIGLAIQLAKDMDAHLVGLAPTGLIGLPITLDSSAIGVLNEAAVEAMIGEAREAEAHFRHACENAGLKSFETVIDKADQVESLVRHAHCSDLCVLGQPDPQQDGFRLARLRLEQVIIQSARPTLIVPYAGGASAVGRNALVAWDDSRESARAVSDALPLLRRAQRVEVVHWHGPHEQPLSPTRMQALARWLLWQGVSAQVDAESTNIDVADAMLSRAADLGTDLIVMGAYGHARWSEIILGGATRGLLASMTAPVLMSH